MYFCNVNSGYRFSQHTACFRRSNRNIVAVVTTVIPEVVVVAEAFSLVVVIKSALPVVDTRGRLTVELLPVNK